MNDEIRPGKIIMIGLAALIALLALGFALDWFGLFTQRPMAKYQEETRKEVYDNSRQFQQGTNRDIARYCLEMRKASDPAAKKAVAAMIRSTASTYDGELNDDNKTCVSDARSL